MDERLLVVTDSMCKQFTIGTFVKHAGSIKDGLIAHFALVENSTLQNTALNQGGFEVRCMCHGEETFLD